MFAATGLVFPRTRSPPAPTGQVFESDPSVRPPTKRVRARTHFAKHPANVAAQSGRDAALRRPRWRFPVFEPAELPNPRPLIKPRLSLIPLPSPAQMSEYQRR